MALAITIEFILEIQPRFTSSFSISMTKEVIMKSTKKILEELGFNKDAPLSTQKACLKNLSREATSQEFTRKKTIPKEDKQLTFPGLEVQIRNNKVS